MSYRQITCILILVDIQYFVYKWKVDDYTLVEQPIMSGDIILASVIILVTLLVCMLLTDISEKKMVYNVTKAELQILHQNLPARVELKAILGVQHNAFVFLMLEDGNYNFYAKCSNDGNVYIWAACDENGKELEHWSETPNEFFHYFKIIGE